MPGRSTSPRSPTARLRLPLHGRRVDLVVPTLAQVPAVVRLLNDASVARWTLHVPHPYTTRDGRKWVRNAAEGRRSGGWLGLTIVRRSDGEVLGGVGLHDLGTGRTRAEVGYWIGRDHRGRGYATEAVNLLVRTGFTRLGLHRIEARVFPGNTASRGVARRCGFRYEGRLRDEVQKDGRWRATLLFARVASDPVPRRKRPSGRPIGTQLRRRR